MKNVSFKCVQKKYIIFPLYFLMICLIKKPNPYLSCFRISEHWYLEIQTPDYSELKSQMCWCADKPVLPLISSCLLYTDRPFHHKPCVDSGNTPLTAYYCVFVAAKQGTTPQLSLSQTVCWLNKSSSFAEKL